MSPPRGRQSIELTQMVNELQNNLGSITSEQQIARASPYSATILLTTKDKLKGDAWEYHLKMNCDRARVMAELMIYRATGQSSSFYIPELKDDPTAIEAAAISELEVCTVAFLRILVEGRLAELERIEDITLEFAINDPIAEKFKAYMVAYQASNEFSSWTHKHIVEMRHNLYQIVHSPSMNRKRSGEVLAEGPSKKFCHGPVQHSPSESPQEQNLKSRLRKSSASSRSSRQASSNRSSNNTATSHASPRAGHEIDNQDSPASTTESSPHSTISSASTQIEAATTPTPDLSPKDPFKSSHYTNKTETAFVQKLRQSVSVPKDDVKPAVESKRPRAPSSVPSTRAPSISKPPEPSSNSASPSTRAPSSDPPSPTTH